MARVAVLRSVTLEVCGPLGGDRLGEIREVREHAYSSGPGPVPGPAL